MRFTEAPKRWILSHFLFTGLLTPTIWLALALDPSGRHTTTTMGAIWTQVSSSRLQMLPWVESAKTHALILDQTARNTTTNYH